MMPKILLGMIFVALAGISFWDGYRIATTLRRPGVYDSLGPDRYLLTIGSIILILGVAIAIQGMREPRQTVPQADREQASNRHLWLLAAICGYTILIWFLGYAVATLAFFVAALWIMGQRDWRWNLSSSAALTAAYYFMFQYAADISLPQGVFG
jgi:hypothetical protein